MNSQLNVILGYFMYMYLQIKLVYMSHYAFSSYIYIQKHHLAPVQWHSEVFIVLMLQ